MRRFLAILIFLALAVFVGLVVYGYVADLPPPLEPVETPAAGVGFLE